MVCAKCEKKYAKSSILACSSVRLNGAASSSSTGQTTSDKIRKVGGNKLLESKNRYTPYSAVSKNGKKGAVEFNKCESCKTTVSRAEAVYCQKCAYKSGLCAICKVQILDIRGYKQSSK